MKRILLIKVTSLGDLIHALPALTDALRSYPQLKIDWMIDESFAEVATWHPAVDRIFVTSHRTWKHDLAAAIKPIFRLIRTVRKTKYDLIIDGQGNFKTAIMSLFLRGPTAGFDRRSVREWVASFAYRRKYPASKTIHAIDRLRQLFSQSLSYPCPATPPDYCIDRARFAPLPFSPSQRYVVLIHNATWKTKLWPERYEMELIRRIAEYGYTIYLPWGNVEEKARAHRLGSHPLAIVLPKMSLGEIGTLLSGANACVSMDTGLSHLAAALSIPTITLYGPTHSGQVGTSGEKQIHLRSTLSCSPCKQRRCRFPNNSSLDPPCLAEITPEKVFDALLEILGASDCGKRALSTYNKQYVHCKEK